MKKFDNLTTNKKEKAIKIGRTVPEDAVGLGYFSSEEVTPQNTLSVLDLSDTIPENRIRSSADNEAVIVYADELGVLRTADGNNSFSIDDLTLGEILVNERTGTGLVDLETVNPNAFVHYYYISKHFIAAPANFSFLGLRDFIPEENLTGIRMSVVDANGNDYKDFNTGRKKYRFLLEPFRTSNNVNRQEIPYRVIVLLDADTPTNLQLLYDKIEVDEIGNFNNQVLRYTETINAVPYFSQVPEESFVMDPNYSSARKFSVKKIDQKYSELVSNEPVKPGYQVFAPRKAIKDYRIFEAFNWRLVARTKRNVNLELVDFGGGTDSAGNPAQKQVNVAVLYSSLNGDTNNNIINPYIFRRLETSPFNLSKYVFVNPNGGTDKNSDAYWKLDIDSISDLSQYDAVAWSPTSMITGEQARKIDNFIKKNGTIILDLSQPTSDAQNLSSQLVKDPPITANNVSIVRDSIMTSADKNGGWNIQDAVFESVNYSIVGSKVLPRTATPKSYSYFRRAVQQNWFTSISQGTGSSSLSIGAAITYPGAGDALTSGNIIATTFPLFSYCNNIYRIGSPEEVLATNYGATFSQDPSTNIYSGVVEGPFKLLYNAVAYAVYSKAKASRFLGVNSSLFNFVTPWNSSWVMDPSALFEDEKNRYFTSVNIAPNTTGLARDLMPSSSTVFDAYKSELSKFLPPVQRSIVDSLSPSEVEFYVECTNADVEFVNAVRVDEDITSRSENIPTAYNLHKLNSADSKLYAYTDKPSPSLTVPASMGAYVIADSIISVSESSNLENRLSVLNNFKSYPFKFTSRYNYVSGRDVPLDIVVSLSTNFQALYNATIKAPNLCGGIDEPAVPGAPAQRLFKAITLNANNIKSAVDKELDGFIVDNVSDPSNCFIYTGDIAIHSRYQNWSNSSSTPKHDYVKYIQYSMAVLSDQYIAIDGIYGPQTAAAVRNFQTVQGQRYIDGIVDSETKAFIGLAWRRLQNTNLAKYNGAKAFADAGIRQYIQAAENMIKAGQMAQSGAYKKISFTGTAGPGVARDILFFEIPPGVDKVDQIVIERPADPKWHNFVVDFFAYSSKPITLLSLLKPNANVEPLGLSASKKNPVINMAGIDADNARYVCIHITGGKIGDIFGPNAEGFGIAAITINGRKLTNPATNPQEPPTVCADPGDTAISVTAYVNVPTVERVNVSTTNGVSRYFTISDLRKAPAWIGMIQYKSNNQTIIKQFAQGEMPVGSTYSDGNLTITFANPTSANLSYTQILNVKDIDGQTYNSDFISLQTGQRFIGNPSSTGSYTLTCSATLYGNAIVKSVTEPVNNEYYLKDLYGKVHQRSTNTVTVTDGVMLLSKADGSPFGIVSAQAIRNAVQGASQDEINTALGIVSVSNDFGETPGFIYGFYDVNQKEFLGKAIPYIDMVDRGLSNIFIGVCAIDADGNTQNKNEFIGPAVDIRFKPVDIPQKEIVPVYSLKHKNSAAIKVTAIPGGLSKFDTWELPISNGAFTRSIVLPSDIAYTDWKEDYKGQSLFAVYSTIGANLSVPSEIFGTGYHDIYDEKPIVLSDKSIQVRRYPILSWNHPTSNLYSLAGIVRPELRVWTRETVNSPWVEVQYSDIRDINCATGVIEFEDRIVPNNPDLIKVSYVSVNSNNLVRQVNGNPIPLNPVLNSTTVNYKSPLYVYLKPTVVYKNVITTQVQGAGGYERVEEYTDNDVVNFTFDSSIFTKSSAFYDPLAIPIAVIYVIGNPYKSEPSLSDIRRRGGGYQDVEQIKPVIDRYPSIVSHWDVFPPSGKAYPKGGYIIIRIPESVKSHFQQPEEIYNIIRSNLTAGIVFDVQDLDGNSWS